MLWLTALSSLRLPQTLMSTLPSPGLGVETDEQDVGPTLEGLSSRRRGIHTLTQLCPNVSGDAFLR